MDQRYLDIDFARGDSKLRNDLRYVLLDKVIKKSAAFSARLRFEAAFLMGGKAPFDGTKFLCLPRGKKAVVEVHSIRSSLNADAVVRRR